MAGLGALMTSVVLGSMLFGVDGVIVSLLVAELLVFCIAMALAFWSFWRNGTALAVQA